MTYYTQRIITGGAVQVLIRTSHRTHPTVTVSRQGDIIVRGPSTTTDAEATALVERRRSWIYRQLTRLTETAPPTTPSRSSSPAQNSTFSDNHTACASSPMTNRRSRRPAYTRPPGSTAHSPAHHST